MGVAAHYRDLLASHYSWMLGGDIEQVATQDRQLLEKLGLGAPSAASVAVDLGCGPGPQTLALADMGFGTVVGVDTSQELLDELAHLARSRPAVRTRHGDLLDALPEMAARGSVDVVVCMRDTLLHLSDLDAVDLLLTRVASSLATGGKLLLTYRDLTQELAGTDRFLPVRSDDERIMLCALDYDTPETVTVNDLVYTRTAEGWELHKSSYPKLRIAPDTLVQRIEAAGLTVTHHAPESNGMWSTVAAS
ncbi:class I SAM-dependent methyltransferase [Prauserella halophila]|uniref:class I SAM-dependent methyltransferase n=1 Tax=Prauserella halophila TaxID=185641 RepID=UPI0020A5B98B|nr:class I SAM-dependent methyltransferase [Prauserella halophila]MCP2237272.1 Methyltransferase domain-containing protein [Prauserella halophila]